VGQQFELAEDFAVSVNRLDTTERAQDSDTGGTLLALAPDFDNDSTGLAPLAFNQAEVKLLKARYQGHFLIGQMGTEGAYWAQEQEADMLHFSTHGLLNDQFPELSALAFTEQRDTLENERLFTGEIREGWRERKLVVLSACETAAGPLYRGEGLLSLARSFYQSGTQNIVATRWRVDDELSGRLMGLFYEQLAEGHSSVAALQRAQRIYLDEEGGIHQHPYFWAAYMHLGPGAQVQLQQRNRWWIWGGVVLLVVVVLAGCVKSPQFNFAGK
jgi:CHAT domain-containing protein